jgi:Kef-type K+ transport system membrane component KefB
MELTAFAEFGIVIGLATFFAIIANKLRQPAILGYIIAGVLVTTLPGFHINKEHFHLFAELGITLLLFILGLELNLEELKKLGKVAMVSGLTQIILTFILGYAFCYLFGASLLTAFYIALGVTSSSTIVVVKLLSLKKDLDSLYGRISIGILLVQDFVAIIVLIGLSAFGKMGSGGGLNYILSELLITFLKGLILTAAIYLFVRYILNPLLKYHGHFF